MTYSPEEIFKSFKGKLVGRDQMKGHVVGTLSQMPADVIDFVTEKCWFLGSFDDAWAFTFTGNDLKEQHLIFLSDDLLLQDDSQIHYTIAHEIGHVVLNHRNSTLVKQSKAEIARQEKEADEFARKYT